MFGAAAAAPNIRLMDERLDGDAVTALVASADVLLSLHRAEGFGLVLADAMALGVRVIATGWSGNLDFCPPETRVPFRLVPASDRQHTYALAGAAWAEPDIAAAARMLAEAARQPRPVPAIPDLLRPERVLAAALMA
jgi:glycosyltransferase involved in cell wall biosynthesis